MIRAAQPLLSLLRRRICGIAAVRSRPPAVPSGVPSSIEPGGDEQKRRLQSDAVGRTGDQNGFLHGPAEDRERKRFNL